MLNRKTLLTVVAVACAISLGGPIAVAQSPEPTLRIFAYVPLGTSPIPDWEGDGSRALTILPDAVDRGIQHTIIFAEGAKLPDGTPFPYAGTKWNSHPVHHATKDGKDQGIYFWLESEDTPDPPPAGAYTFTGPDGLLVVEGSVWIVQCGDTGADCPPGTPSTHYTTSLSSGERFVIGHALFSK